jgi:drug/metabolite transporter (DMT)-like permease
MLRIVIQHLLLFLLPLAAYAVYLAIMRRRAQSRGTPQPQWEEGPWYWLALAGLVISVGAFALLGFTGGYKPDTDYVPSRIENGKVIPGKRK